MANNPQNQLSIDDQSEISLLDILLFLKGAWKVLVTLGLVGAALSTTYIMLAPKKYEAVAQITMAQIGLSSNNNINPLGVNIEEPSMLIVRMSSPTSFTPPVIAACVLEDQDNAALQLTKSIKLTVTKGVANVVELKTFGKTPQAAYDCNLAIFDLIKATQSQIVVPYIEEAKIKLADDEERLSKAKDLVAKADKSGSAMSASYLSTRDEIRYLLDEITALKNVVTSNQNRVTRLVAPIYVGDMPISPKKRLALAVGLLGGLFFGLLITLGQKVIARMKSEIRGAL